MGTKAGKRHVKGRSDVAQQALMKVTWLRSRPNPTMHDVIETMDALAECVERLDFKLRSIQGSLARDIADVQRQIG